MLRRTMAGLLVIGALGCGSTTQPSGPTNGTLTATVDGSGWAAQTIVAAYRGGVLSIAGTDGQQRSLGFALGPTTAPGTFPVGVTQSANGSYQVVSGSTSQAWMAAVTLGSGSITVTSISATRAVGIFQFSMAPVPGNGATGTKSITQGTFDVTY
ncbi:MAG: DUF6252 family protein [Gemmatimonadales bacterium]